MSLGAPASAAGALYQGQAQQAALDQQASVQRANAKLDIAKGNADAGRQQIMAGEKMGQIQGAASAAGVTQSGSVLSVLGASAQNSELDRLNILHGAQVRSTNAENQASMDELGAKSAMQGAYMSAFGSLLTGSAQTFGNQKGASTTGDVYDEDGSKYSDAQAQRDIETENSGSAAGSSAAEEEGLGTAAEAL